MNPLQASSDGREAFAKSDLFCEGFGMGRPAHGTVCREVEMSGHKVLFGEADTGSGHGMYATVECGRLWESEHLSDTASVITMAVREIASAAVSFPPERILVAALGNGRVTVDSVGSKAADMIVPSGKGVKDVISEVYVIKTGVPAAVGMDSAEIVSVFAGYVKAQLIICIDSLAAATPQRLGTVVQVTDAGITPGSGLAQRTVAISDATMGIPVIAVGVPTVIRSAEGGVIYTCAEASRLVDRAAAVIAGGVNGFLYGK